jgi:putative endonuclease
VRLGRNELDIIARDGDTIVFVEVRTRRVEDPVPPEDTVGPTKMRHLHAAADWYIARHPSEKTYYRFDIVSVILPDQGPPAITHFPNAF